MNLGIAQPSGMVQTSSPLKELTLVIINKDPIRSNAGMMGKRSTIEGNCGAFVPSVLGEDAWRR